MLGSFTKKTAKMYLSVHPSIHPSIKKKRWRLLWDIPWSWNLNIIKMSVFLRLNYRFNTIPTKISMDLFENLEEMILKFLWKNKQVKYPKTFWEVEVIRGMSLTLFDGKNTICSSILIKPCLSGTRIDAEIRSKIHEIYKNKITMW